MGVLTEQDEILIKERFNDLLGLCERIIKSDEDRVSIIRAFELANEAHKEMKRKSGEPYIIHPIAVAKIVIQEIGLGTTSVVCALLHDIVEDTDYTLEYIEANFGSKIATIVDGLTKISGVFDKNSSLQAENFRKMLLTLSDDVRVILIKLADRLHNMRTLDALPPHKQIKIAGETIFLYAPLAHRLGLYTIKTELEDLSLKYRHPKIYNDIVARLHDTESNRKKQIEVFSRPIVEILKRNNISFEISGRPKSIYSIYYKMQHKSVPFEEVYDLLAVRIVFDPVGDIPEKTQCWNIYSLITDIYMPKPERIRDWVSTPKANGYEALHVTVMGPSGKWAEVQIRTRRMDDIAERGFAAHWKYKSANQESELDKWLKNIREMLDNPSANAVEFLDEFKLNLFTSEIHVFTPKGQIRTLPKNSTALDFAYDIHSHVGNSAIAAKVNHKLVPLNHVLASGDQVEILTSDKKKTQREWLDYVVSAKAKAAINDSIKAESKNRIELGKQILERKLSEMNLLPSSRIFKKLYPAYDVVSKDELYSKIGTGVINLEDLVKVLKKNTKNKWIRYWELQMTKVIPKKEDGTEEVQTATGEKIDPKTTFLIRESEDGSESNYRLAKCCNPIPGDDIVGHRSANEDVVVIHKSRCPNAVKLVSAHANLLIQAKWTTYKILSFLARISIRGIEKFGIYNQITTVISKELNVNIRAINLSSHDGIFEGTMDLYVHNAKDLNNLLDKLANIKGVEQVARVENLVE
ncbi:MAG: RelA/SpoT family protein [Bacteroidota bacterium]|nr:RelA/SpoT family protein [Bacteroidota bacterium]